MKIIHLYKDYSPVVGGIENHIKWLAEAQAARGHEVSVLVTSRNLQTHVEMMNGVRVIFASRLATISSAPISIELPRLLHCLIKFSMACSVTEQVVDVFTVGQHNVETSVIS